MAAAGNVLELADSYHLGATLISLLQLFQLSPAPGILHGISVALLLSSLKNHTLSKFIELTFICSKFVFFQSLRDSSVSIF